MLHLPTRNTRCQLIIILSTSPINKAPFRDSQSHPYFSKKVEIPGEALHNVCVENIFLQIRLFGEIGRICIYQYNVYVIVNIKKSNIVAVHDTVNRA